MRYDKVRLSQYKEYGDDWIAIGFKFGIGFFAAASIFAVIGTLIVNAWFAYNDRNLWYSYSSPVPAERSGHIVEQAGPQPLTPPEHDTLVPAKPGPASAPPAELKSDPADARMPPSRERPPPR
jgi:hypothetical protein